MNIAEPKVNLPDRQISRPPRAIAILNQKGGSGKTATAVSLSAAYARAGKRVLLVDMDPQANATTHLGFTPDPERCTVQLLVQQTAASQLILQTKTPGLDLLPSHLVLSNAEFELASAYGRELVLKRALRAVASSYDLIFFDSPPTLGLFPTQVIIASTHILVPIASDTQGVDGLRGLQRTLRVLQDKLDIDAHMLHPFLTRFDPRKNIHKEVLEKLKTMERSTEGMRLLETRIRENVKVSEAASDGRDIFSFDSTSNAAHDYQRLAEEVSYVLV